MFIIKHSLDSHLYLQILLKIVFDCLTGQLSMHFYILLSGFKMNQITKMRIVYFTIVQHLPRPNRLNKYTFTFLFPGSWETLSKITEKG